MELSARPVSLFRLAYPVVVSIGLVMGMPSTVLSQALSKAELLQMRQAGVAEPILIKKVKRDGINFTMSAGTIAELKRAGLSDSVISALIDAEPRGDSRSTATKNQYDSDIRAMYMGARYAELVDRLHAILAEQPTDYRSRAILVTVLLKLHERALAMSELNKIKNDDDPSAKKYAAKLDALIAALDRREASTKDLETTLETFNIEEARRKIETFPASDAQKVVLKAYFDVFQAKFDDARDVISTLGTTHYVQAQHLRESVGKTEADYLAARKRLDAYLYSPLAVSVCSADHPEMTPALSELKIEEYLDIVGTLAQISPLDEWTMDLVFHAQMMASDPEQLNVLGDRLLAAKGTLKIPFYSSDRFFRLVIDGQRRRLYSEADNHPFTARYSATFFGVHENTPTNPWNADLVPFDLAFDAITSLKQDANSAGGTGTTLSKRSYALKLEPAGVAPHYALMHLLECKAGDAAQRRATNNLGRFLLHVINSPRLKANLIDPAKASSGPSQLSQIFSALYAATPQHSVLQPVVVRAEADENSRRVEAVKQQGTAWYSILVSRSNAVIDQETFADFEKLLEIE